MENSFSANQRTVVKMNMPPNYFPAGLAADVDGFLYTSAFGGGGIVKIDPK